MKAHIITVVRNSYLGILGVYKRTQEFDEIIQQKKIPYIIGASGHNDPYDRACRDAKEQDRFDNDRFPLRSNDSHSCPYIAISLDTKEILKGILE